MHGAWLLFAQIGPDTLAVIKSGGSAAVIVVLTSVVVKLHRDHALAQAQLLAQAKEHAKDMLDQRNAHVAELLTQRDHYDKRIETLTNQRIEELGTVTAALGTVTSLATTLTQSHMNPTPVPPPPRRMPK